MAFNSPTDIDKVMTAEQFTLIVEAILAGKYSWACVLILRFAGYNPLHYIPYRTYNRLMKDNRFTTQSTVNQVLSHTHHPPTPAASIRDLNYLEPLNRANYNIHGGYCRRWLTPFDSN